MRGDARSKHVLWLMIGLLAALAVSAVAADETFCVMQHTGYFNLSGNTLTFWCGTGGSGNEPEFAFITVTVTTLADGGLGPSGLPGDVLVDSSSWGAAPAPPSITVEWIDFSNIKRSSGTINLYGNSYTFYARWAAISGKGRGFYTITFNPCGTD